MNSNTLRMIEKLQAAHQPLAATDPMPEAGRKALLGELIQILQHEAGSRTGVEAEDIHQMRVAIRRSRSILQLLRPYFKKKVIRRYDRGLRHTARVLGEVRDLDVLMMNLRAFKGEAALDTVLEGLESQRFAAHKTLVKTLDGRDYRRLVKSFGKFLTHEGEGVKGGDQPHSPSEIRHVLPTLIYDRLAAVLAYDNALENADELTFHALRIEFKRLRYCVSLFEPLLGSPIRAFIQELKQVQDCLGEMNDCSVAHDRLTDLPEAQQEALADYLSHLEDRRTALQAQIADLWGRFNTRRVQQRLASAVLALR